MHEHYHSVWIKLHLQRVARYLNPKVNMIIQGLLIRYWIPQGIHVIDVADNVAV